MTEFSKVPVEERFHLLVDGVTEYAIFMLDPIGTVATWNKGAHRIKGYAEDEIVGKHFSVFFVNDDVSDGKPQRLLAEAAANGRAEDEGWRIRKDGSRFWANVVITALSDDDGELRGFAKITRDDTARREAMQERLRLEMLEVREGVAQELHHEVIERLFGVGLLLNGVQQHDVPPQVATKLGTAVDELDAVIRHIRTTLWTAGSPDRASDAVAETERELEVLVVDDDPDMRALLSQVLEGVGSVRAVADGYQAWELLESQSVDVMVLDLMLPGVNGVELLERSHTRGRAVPTVVVTAMAPTDRLASAAKAAGAELVVTKPFDAERLRTSVRRAAAATPS